LIKSSLRRLGLLWIALVLGLDGMDNSRAEAQTHAASPTPAAPQHWASNNHPLKERDFLFVAQRCERLEVLRASAYGRWYALSACRLPSNDDHPEIGVDEGLFDNDNRLIGFKRKIRKQSTQEVLQKGYYTTLSMDSVQCSKFMELGLPVITVVRRRYCEAMLNGEL